MIIKIFYDIMSIIMICVFTSIVEKQNADC